MKYLIFAMITGLLSGCYENIYYVNMNNTIPQHTHAAVNNCSGYQNCGCYPESYEPETYCMAIILPEVSK